VAKITDLHVYRDQREANLPVWRVVKGHCTSCDKGQTVSVQHEECPLDNSECSACRQMTWKVTHFENNEVFVPRLEVV
jgi:hypothetical protein